MLGVRLRSYLFNVCFRTTTVTNAKIVTLHHVVDTTKKTPPTLDLRDNSWGEGDEFKLDGLWHAYWGNFLSLDDIRQTDLEPIFFPVPGVWSDQPNKKNRHTIHKFETENIDHLPKQETQEKILPALGIMTYHAKVLLPENLENIYLYVPDMPSAYKLFINGELVSSNGKTGFFQNTEVPGFSPKVIKLDHSGELDIIIHLSNFHYRDGGTWFRLRLPDDSGYFNMAQRPVISAVFFAGILIAIGLYNFSFFAFRSKEVAALYFGLL